MKTPNEKWDRDDGSESISVLLSQAPDLFIAVSPDLRLSFCNDNALKALEMTTSYFGQKIDTSILLGSLVETAFEKVMASGGLTSFTHEVPLDEGHKVFSGAYQAVRDPRGKIIGATAVLRDVSLLRARDSEAFEAKSYYEAQTRALNVFDIVAETDRRGQITYVNDRFVEISKYSREELIGEDHRIVNSGIHPKSFFREMWSKISKGNVWSGEICNRAKDGSLYWVSTVITPVLDSRKSIRSFLAIRRDITLQKQQEETLKVSELRFRELLENIPSVALSLDLKGRVTFVNRSLLALLGCRPDEVLGNDWFSKFIPLDKRSESIDLFSRILVGDESALNFEAQILDGSGERRTILWKNAVFRQASGDLLGVTALGDDVTDKRKMDERMLKLRQQTERQREEMMAFVSHELRSPLMNIRMNTDLLRNESANNHQEHLNAIDDEVGRIDRVSKDFIESCTNRMEDLQFDFRPAHLNRLLDKISRRFIQQLKQNENIRLFYHPAETEVVGLWDLTRLDQLISNLISNAIKYSKPEGGEIHLRMMLEQDQVHLLVEDQGVGIPEENLETIFELFSRGSNVKQSTTEGFGLGLKIARDIVERHRGKICAESRLHEGSTFHVLLPFNPNTSCT